MGQRYQCVAVDLETCLSYPPIVVEEVQQSFLDGHFVGGINLHEFHQLNNLGQIFFARVTNLVELAEVSAFYSTQVVVVSDIARLVGHLPEPILDSNTCLRFNLVDLILNVHAPSTHRLVVTVKVIDEARTPRTLDEIVVGLPAKNVFLLFECVVQRADDAQAAIADKQGKLKHLPGMLDW